MGENEHDITKKMLDVIRENKMTAIASSTRGLLRENDGSITPTDSEKKEEEKKIGEIVSPRVRLSAFNIYPNDNNVVLAGEFDNGLSFQFSKKDGLYVNADNLKLDNEMADMFKKLNAYYSNWADEWATKLNTDYKPRQ